MFASSYGNCACQVIVWRDKDGKEWAQAHTLLGAMKHGTEPLEPVWAIVGTPACRR